MVNPPVGVLRAVLHFDSDVEEVEHSGSLLVEIAEDELYEGDVVLYTLDEHRLRGVLDAVRSGASDEDILLALDAAALAAPDDEDEVA